MSNTFCANHCCVFTRRGIKEPALNIRGPSAEIAKTLLHDGTQWIQYLKTFYMYLFIAHLKQLFSQRGF